MTDFSLEFVFASGERHSPKAEPNEWLLRSDADTVADSLTVRFSAGKRLFTEEPVGAVLKKDSEVLFDGIVDEHRVKCRNGARTEIVYQTQPQNAPVERGTPLGTATLLEDGIAIAECRLIAGERVDQATPVAAFLQIIRNWILRPLPRS